MLHYLPTLHRSSLSDFGADLHVPGTKSDLLHCLEQPEQPEPPSAYCCKVFDGAVIVHCLPVSTLMVRQRSIHSIPREATVNCQGIRSCVGLLYSRQLESQSLPMNREELAFIRKCLGVVVIRVGKFYDLLKTQPLNDIGVQWHEVWGGNTDTYTPMPSMGVRESQSHKHSLCYTHIRVATRYQHFMARERSQSSRLEKCKIWYHRDILLI